MRVTRGTAELGSQDFDACVVGAGAIGLTLAGEMSSLGLRVVVLEAGGARPAPPTSRFPVRLENPDTHAAQSSAVAHGLGGTTGLWGGRCMPLDVQDLVPREHIPESGWPISESDVAPHYAAAAKWLGCGSADFTDPTVYDAVLESSGASIRHLERWCADPFTPSHVSGSFTVALETPVVRLRLNETRNRIVGLWVGNPDEPTLVSLAPIYVLACGGLENTRQLLTSQEEKPDLFGGQPGSLGRYYMGHLSGQIGSVAFRRPTDAKLFRYLRQPGSATRRRFTLSAQQQQEGRLPNISFYPANPRLGDASHKSGILSLLFLLISAPLIGERLIAKAIREAQLSGSPHYGRHILNVLTDLPRTVGQGIDLAFQRFVEGRKKPLLFLASADGRYPLHYHGEHAPDRESRISLRRGAGSHSALEIRLRFSEEDADGVVRGHNTLGDALRSAGFADVSFPDPDPGALRSAVLAQARDGIHQIGTTRMGSGRRDGVVDKDCRTFDVSNLYVAGSSVFRTSGQANPTFFAAALAVRLAHHLCDVVRKSSS